MTQNSSPWHRRPIVAIDVETTGLDVETERVVEIALATIRFDLGMIPPQVDAWTALVNPGVPVPPGAMAVHGISDAVLAAEGRSPVDALGELMERLDRIPADAVLVIANAPYDLSLLDREVRRHLGRSLGGAALTWPVVDPMVLDRYLDPDRKGRRRLVDLADHYGAMVPGTDVHRAYGDALTAARVTWRIGDLCRQDRFPGRAPVAVRASVVPSVRERLRSIRDLLPDVLHARQRVWHAEQGQRFSDRRSGWPMIPHPDEAGVRS